MTAFHRAPFGLPELTAAVLRDVSLGALEAAYADAVGMHALWLPCARAGIEWALRASGSEGKRVAVSAFTCAVVHEAIARSGAVMRVLDLAGDDSFLLSAATLAQQADAHALVLSEPFGLRYDLAAVPEAALRVVDMAMAIPHPQLFARLGARDFALLSFGEGKSMFATWGAMAFTRDAGLVAKVRALRDAAVVPPAPGEVRRRTIRALDRIVAATPAAPFLKTLLGRARTPDFTTPPRAAECVPFSTAPLAAHWLQASSRIDRGLALANLRRAPAARAHRLRLVARYAEGLAGMRAVAPQAAADEALSCFTVRVEASRRPSIRAALHGARIETDTLWAFSPSLDPAEFPHAARASAEVLNLPLHQGMNEADVERVCAALRQASGLGF